MIFCANKTLKSEMTHIQALLPHLWKPAVERVTVLSVFELLPRQAVPGENGNPFSGPQRFVLAGRDQGRGTNDLRFKENLTWKSGNLVLVLVLELGLTTKYEQRS